MKNLVRALCLSLCGFGLLAGFTAQAQPANDSFANRIVLTGLSADTTGSNVGATTEAGEPSRIDGYRFGASVWWSWTAPASGTVRITTFGSSFDTVLAVCTGSLGALNVIVGNNNAPGVDGGVSLVTFNAQAGTQYQILVGGRGTFPPATGSIQLHLTMLPSVSITSPTSGKIFGSGTPIPIEATASSPNGAVTQVDFYRTSALIGSDATAPYSTILNNAPLGTNSLFAVVTDSAGLVVTSAVVNVTVLNLGVTITSPADGATYLNNNPITVTAVGFLSSGSITNLEFYADGVKFGEAAGSQGSATWSAVVPGAHRLTVTGKDSTGAAYNSAPVMIAVARTLVASNTVWKYLDNGSDQGTAWTAIDFDDSAWASGPSPLGYGDVNGVPPTTTNSFGPDPNNKYTTTYYRQAFVLNEAGYTNLIFHVQRDDGAVIYVNGVEAARLNMPAGTITYSTFAAAVAGDDGATTFTVNVNPYTLGQGNNVLVNGTNVVAVEVHQSDLTSSDIWMQLDLLGVPVIIRNQPPLVSFTSPANNASFLAPSAITLTADASDADGSVAKVEFFADGAKLGEATNSPYSLSWTGVPLGWHTLRAVATDNEGGSASTSITVNVYDAAGSPLVQLTSPANGAAFDGPTNLSLTAQATAATGVTNVLFLANGAVIGSDATSPYSIVWNNATFGTDLLAAVAFNAQGVSATSAVASIFVTTPPVNTNPPTIFSVNPAAGAALGSLTSIQVTFSEQVVGVNASDLLVNGVPATGVSGTGSNYTFTVVQPGVGAVAITWAAGHGITDIGWPSSLPFDQNGPGATWSYTLLDLTPPTVAAKSPPAGAQLTNLTQITVTFSEPVAGVDAADLLINGAPAFSLSGAGATYTFNFSQPAAGTVNISWASGHGIADLAASPNPFNAGGAGATWSYTLDPRTILVQSNATWRLLKGYAEASTPMDAWRFPAFDESAWSNAPAAFFYGDTGYSSAQYPGTSVADMANNAYSSIFLRTKFFVPGAAGVTNLYLNGQSDDGYIAWINGVEVVRYNMPAGEIAYNGSASGAVNEPNNNGAGWILQTLANANSYLVEGTNELAVQAFNVVTTPASSDFGFNMQLYTYLADPSVVPPRVAAVSPSATTEFYLTNITVTFTEPVSGVNAADLLVNGVPATGLNSTTNTTYTFSFPQPPYGTVAITWAAGHGIVDFDAPPKPFNGTAPGSTWQYTLFNPNAPTVASQSPLAGNTVTNLTQLTVTFSKPVTGVNAGDLLVNGVPATGVSGSSGIYTFTFPQPAYGTVAVGWAASHGIQDLSTPPNAFEASRAGSTWAYTLIDQVPPMVAAQNPPAGAQVTNLTQLTVTFSEPVTGVNASDLLINGSPATGLSGGSVTYTFTFPQPNATVVNITWANNHGIRDLAPVPNAFDPSAPGNTWAYTTPDNLPPALLSVTPPAGATVRSLTQITVTFSEPVTGVDTNDLLINSRPARQVSGSGAGPYTFSFLQPSNGPVEVRWSPTHGITDLATPPNAFVGGEITYTLDPNASFADKVIINEIMFNAPGGRMADEWLELHNTSSDLVNLAGWRFTRGVNFTFPNVSIPAGGYLVVAANLAAFQAKYPAVTNVVGGWTGSLANSDETIELVTAMEETAAQVHYATEGDWARRDHAGAVDLVAGIVRSGSTATVTIFNHGYSSSDQVMISGADQPEYNGRFSLSSITPSTFNITVAGTPATPATGTIVCRQVIDNGQTGWAWFCPADGFGSSLELVNPAMPNGWGQNWLSSSNLNGTPGQVNSVLTTNVAPFIQDLTHFPAVPKSTDPVAITARVRDELSNGVQNVTLFYRLHTANYGTAPPAFLSQPMLDDGAHNDGVAGDDLYGYVLPAAANGSVVEFYVQATDTSGLVRTWPAPAWNTNGVIGQFANALYQVDNEVITNVMPSVRVILTGTERALFPPSDRNGNAQMNCTMVSMDGDGTKVRYTCGVRVRGAGTRSRTPTNNRLDIPNDNRWNNQRAVNLNCQFIHASLVGNVLAQKSGLPATDAHVVQYRVNGSNPAPITAPVNGGGNGAGWGTYLMLEPVAGDLAAELYPDDGGGNVYRASTGNHNADLYYYGTNPNSYLSHGYFKTSNRAENDWTDLFNLTYAFSQVTADADYLQAVSTNINVKEWMTYFAVGTLMNYGETALFNGIGDDYALYRGEQDPRFVLIGHDFDTIFGQGDTGSGYYPINVNSSIYIMLNPPNPNGTPATLQTALSRFMKHPRHAPIFFSELKRLCDTTFNPSQLNPLLDQLLTGWGVGPDATTIGNMKNYAANRRLVVLSQIPLTLTVSNTLTTLSNYLYTTAANVTLFGTAHAIDTRKVLVNGNTATWSPWDARWTNTLTLRPGINRVLVQSLNSNDVEFARATVDIWYDDASVQSVSGTITTDTAWTAAAGPYNVTGNLTINAGATLTIQPGTTVYLASGVNLTVANGGRLLAEGTPTAPIRLGRAPGSTATWGGITITGAPGSPETRLAYVHIEGNGSTAIHSANGTLFMDHVTFGSTGVQYLSLDNSSFLVQDCVFPSGTDYFELVHGTGGIKTGGRGIFVRNFFGMALSIPSDYNDVIDFTGGNRPGDPLVHFIDNVFIGASDDHLDLDGTDAWVQGNIFMHAHKNGSPDTSSGISGGADSGHTSEVTIIGNIFYDCDHAAMAKEGNFFTLLNNTIVHQTRVGGTDTEGAVVCLADVGTTQGAGMYLEGNIIYDAEQLTQNVSTAVVTFTNNLLSLPWGGPGGNNVTADPLFAHVPQLAETTGFTNWAGAQVMRQWLSLRTGSPASGTGPNGTDKGGVIPLGVSISGEPVGATPQTTATLRVGLNRTDSGIPGAGWPNGSGYTHYQWRLDGGVWSVETPINTPITLSALGNGPHSVDVIGKLDSGLYQDDPAFGVDAVVTSSRTWVVDSSASLLRLSEILASNAGVVNHNGTTPDCLELYNANSSAMDLTGVRLTDDPQNPDKFIFPVGASIPAGGYLVVYANNPDGTPGYHLGFNLNQQGESVFLYDRPEDGGVLLDSVSFGPQLTDLSVGRLADGSWALTVPTFGAVNRAAPVGDPTRLRINEWLALGQAPFANDFIELYNADPLPVSLGGLYMSDEVVSWPNQHQIAALSFIPGSGYIRFFADGDPAQGPEHLNFRLAVEQGGIGLYLPDLTPVDIVMYQPQRPNVSQGRSPNGSSTIVFFDQPTPGAPNPLITGPAPNGGVLVINEVLALNSSLAEADGRTPDWIELYNGTTNTVDLSDHSLSDDPQQARRFVFPAGAQMAPGAFLRVFCDGDLPVSTNNTGFGLKSTGGSVYLFDALPGGSLLDASTYGLQAANLSIGRVPDGGTNWVLTVPTPGTPNTAVPTLGDQANLKVNEWMAGPASGDDWFEIYNPNTQPVALGGLWLTDDLNNRTKHLIAPLSFLGAGTNAWQQFVADSNTGAGADHVAFGLKISGEAVGISTAAGTLIDGVVFGQQLTGISEGRFPDGSTNIVSFPNTDSPGESNYRWLTNVVINEVLTHTDPPLEDAIELRNLTAQDIDISGWWLSDDKGTLQKYQIPSPTLLPANGFVVIYEYQFTNRELAAIPFALSSQGDEVVLAAAANDTLTGWRRHVKFGAAANGVSFGRYITSDNREEFVAMSARTFGFDDPASVEEFRTGHGAPNAYPRVGPVVISEIMYHPPDVGTNDNVADEFIELHNITSVPVLLYDPAAPTNVWHLRDAVDFDFPAGTALAAGEYLLVVSFDPINNGAALAAFRSKYHVDPGTQIVGPYSGKLANSSDEIELRKPGAPETNDVPYILVEHVRYYDSLPWPMTADGTGFSLQRLSDTLFGNDPANWTAAAPTPGPQAAPLDADGDGMPDWWETAHSLNPYSAGDANLDPDGDGLTNLQEYLAGTDPHDPLSALRIDSIVLALDGTNVVLTFTARANRAYTVECAAALDSGAWQSCYSLSAATTDRVIQLTLPHSESLRFYRLRTP